jgi:ribosomal protein S18 acetylase RimI-like enzyme
MAALPEWPEPRLVELRRISADDLLPLLDEETVAWQSALDWDLRPSCEIVRRFVRMQSLNGFALVDQHRVLGFAYYVAEEHKGLIGDLHIFERDRTPEREAALIEACLDAMWRTPGIRRVETQLLLLSEDFGRLDAIHVPYARQHKNFPRWYMQARSSNAVRLPGRKLNGITIAPWMESYRDSAARLITSAYGDHIDAQINDQYRSLSGALRFLNNIIEYPGCGTFFQPASFAAADRSLGMLCGLSLASLVAADSGHITQLCVSPSHRGEGLGYELLRRSLLALAAHGCRTVSLTVTAANANAVKLYEDMGFTKRREFSAHIWDLNV